MYKDPLHFNRTELIIMFGERGTMLSKAMLDQQNAWLNKDLLLEAHFMRMMVYDLIEETEDLDMLFKYGQDLKLIENELQMMWGFEVNSLYHKFWMVPKCTCPKMDNEDWYPHKQVISGGCPVHQGEY